MKRQRSATRRRTPSSTWSPGRERSRWATRRLSPPARAALVPAGEEAAVAAHDDLDLVVATVGAGADRHAPMGRARSSRRPWTTRPRRRPRARARSRSCSTRATARRGRRCSPASSRRARRRGTTTSTTRSSGSRTGRAGSIVDGGSEDLGSGSAFRLRPREVHIVENTSPDRELTIIGLFTPAGSPSAAYLTPEVAAEYRFAG